ncbi:hypothetical protein LTR36_006254 [Oleoguttula mirabilis]|uniref:D-arabinono-1,4-lactone oxidase n=1 Tax=Oleoguttula mirabilis TaxID=1507867 RepID=A0AAV9JCJ8_9PEZI|nr:hypothetical protein LTR36_006254 [Oleoguttula mirabilis]
MDAIQQEVAKSDPAIPFRASTSHTHYTWAKTFQCRPELYITPHTLPEIQKVVDLARKCRRRIVVVGCGHSPSTLTCTSSWMVNLDHYDRVLHIDPAKKTLLVEGGIRLRQLNIEANKVGLTMPNLGSIDEQSIAGAIATATHGSALRHGLMSESVRSLRLVLANGQAVRCSSEENRELFRAGLVSLGALGIITEVEFQMRDACNIEWEQSLEPLGKILDTWHTTLWTRKEYTRVWWMPYMKRAIVWSAETTTKSLRQPEESFYGGSVGFHTYHNLLWLSNYVPAILPWVEWFVFGMQYGFKAGGGPTASAVEPLRTGLLMNCLYSQFVNEWALPLHKGPEAITRLSAWLNGEHGGGGIPFSNKGLYVHCPIEVRVSDTSRSPTPRPYLDNTDAEGPTLYLNATLYRAYLRDPPCKDRYYEAFEWLMREMGGKPHYAKNWQFTDATYIQRAFGGDLREWVRVRDEADPEGMFVGEWHRAALGLGGGGEQDGTAGRLALAEREVERKGAASGPGDCVFWRGAVPESSASASAYASGVGGAVGASPSARHEEEKPAFAIRVHSPSASATSGESYDMMHGSEARSMLLSGSEYDDEDDRDDGEGEGDAATMERDDRRFHGNRREGWMGTQVFDKM